MVGRVMGKDESSREIMRRLEADGWRRARQSGSHVQFKHPDKPGLVTVPHPRKSLSPKTRKSIYLQAG
jgi:predicted RNA binding protein YcfA (HicA-like mRNA interferase family)